MTKSTKHSVPTWESDNELTRSIFLHISTMKKMVLERYLEFAQSWETELTSIAVSCNELSGVKTPHRHEGGENLFECLDKGLRETWSKRNKCDLPLNIEKKHYDLLNDDNSYKVTLEALLAKDWKAPNDLNSIMCFMLAAFKFYNTLTPEGKFYLESDLPNMLTIDRRTNQLCTLAAVVALGRSNRETAAAKKIGEIKNSRKKDASKQADFKKAIPHIKETLSKKYPKTEGFDKRLIKEYPTLHEFADELRNVLRNKCNLKPQSQGIICNYFKEKYTMPAKSYPQKLPLIIKSEGWLQ